MSHTNVPILIITTAPPQSSDNHNPDNTTPALKPLHPASQKRGNGSKSNVSRVRKSNQNDKSEPLRRSEVNVSYNNASLLSIEKKLHDESALDNISNTSRSIFSTDSPRDIKNIPSIAQKSYYLGVINPNNPIRKSHNNRKSLYVGGSAYPSVTLDESNAHAYRNEGSTVLESNPKNTSKVQSLNSVQSKRPSSIGNKLYHGFKRPYASQNLSDQAESFEMPRLGSPQQNFAVNGNANKEKQVEEPNLIPRPPSKGPINKARTLAPPALDHRRPKKAGTEVSSMFVKTNLDLDSKAYCSLPVDYIPQSMTNLPSQDNRLENGNFSGEPYSVLKHRRLRPDIDRKALNRASLNSKASKENDLYSLHDLSHNNNIHHNMKIPLKPLSGNANSNAARRALNNKAPSSELRGSSKDELMRRFNDIVAYQSQPGQAGNQQVLQEKNRNEGHGLRPIVSAKDKENARRRSVKPQNENKPAGSETQKGKKPAEVYISATDAKIMMLKNKIKDKEYKRKTRKNQCLEEGEHGLNGIPLKTKLAEHMGNKSELEEDMRKKLLVMRKIQLYDILIKQKTGKKLKKEALKLVKAEFDKVNQELSELKLHEH